MNSVKLYGRLVADPQKQATSKGDSITRFRIAVRRNYKNKDGEYDSDFISCTAFKSTADNIANYFQKGSRIIIEGTLHTGSYEKDGNKVYTTDVWVDRFHFVDAAEKKEQSAGEKFNDMAKAAGYKTADEIFGEEIDDGELPF